MLRYVLLEENKNNGSWAIGHVSENGGISFLQEEATVLYALLQNALNDPDVTDIPAQQTEQIEFETPKETVDETALFNILAKHNLEYVDKREKGGALWIVGAHELDSVMMECKEAGYKFIFSEKGGRITQKKPGWYLPSSK